MAFSTKEGSEVRPLCDHLRAQVDETLLCASLIIGSDGNEIAQPAAQFRDLLLSM